jgi:hypothetical protein
VNTGNADKQEEQQLAKYTKKQIEQLKVAAMPELCPLPHGICSGCPAYGESEDCEDNARRILASLKKRKRKTLKERAAWASSVGHMLGSELWLAGYRACLRDKRGEK